jgi:WD40 repeat protein
MNDHVKQIHKKTLETHVLRGHYDDRFDKDGNRYKGGLHSIDMTPDEKYVITGGTDDRVIIWKDGAIKHVISYYSSKGTYNGHEKERKAPWLVRSTTDSKYIIAASMDGWVRCFNIESGFACKSIKMNEGLPEKMYLNDKFVFICCGGDLKVTPLSKFGL